MPDELNNEAIEIEQTDIDNVDEPVEGDVEQEEVDSDEPQETDDDEVAGDDEVIEDGEPEPEDDSEELDFAEWAKQYGELPDSIKSEDDLIEAYTNMLPEMKRGQTSSHKLQQIDALLKAQGIDGGIDGFLGGNFVSPKVPEKTNGATSYFDTAPTKNVVEKMMKDGMIRNSDQTPGVEESYKAVANVVDSAIGPQLGKVEEVYTVLAKTVTELRNKVREMEWAGLPSKARQGVDRTEIDKLMEKGLFDSYEKAINFHAFNNPNVLKKLAETSEEAGRTKERKKLKKNRGALRKNKSSKPSRNKWNYDRYLGPDGNWNDAELNKLPIEKQVKMLEDFEKENYKR